MDCVWRLAASVILELLSADRMPQAASSSVPEFFRWNYKAKQCDGRCRPRSVEIEHLHSRLQSDSEVKGGIFALYV